MFRRIALAAATVAVTAGAALPSTASAMTSQNFTKIKVAEATEAGPVKAGYDLKVRRKV